MLKQPRNYTRQNGNPRMTARQKREALGVVSLIVGIVFTLLGFLESYAIWEGGSPQQQVLRLIEQEIAPWTFLGFVGVILIAVGFLLILASSNKQARRDVKRFFGYVVG